MRKTSAWPLSQMCVALIVYASLYPFDHWRDQGIWSWSFLTAPWPKYWLGFDVVANVLGYAPLGFFLTLSAMRMGWQTRVVTLSTLAAAVLSLAMEGLQSYLPARVPSLPDFLLNTLGAWIGAVLASSLERLGLLRRWSQFRERWFVRDAYMALVLMAVWPAALLFPVAVPLGLGQVWERVEDALTSAFDATPFEDWIPLRAFELEPLLPGAELLCVMLGLLVPCLLGFGVIRQAGQRFLYMLLVLCMALGVSALSAALSYGPVHAWTWLDLPVMLGLIFGCVVALFFLPLSARTAWTFLLLALLVQQSVLNQSPESAYFAQTLQTWEQGRFIRFHGLVQWLGWLWPYAVLMLALVRVSRDRSTQN
ncbi:VanZ family protein [Limnohabitans sp. Rim8]|uniref:VanZ family protein n=1 Tax=Limnohabitans sp. Rim8 TaxID=1100718 RepID=UPI000D38AB3F|nr:VanZ family protein [Limnohabitans sp. Rim8]PUE57205.1 VanZ family protein [Limnohabitans sp. Rim8]